MARRPRPTLPLREHTEDTHLLLGMRLEDLHRRPGPALGQLGRQRPGRRHDRRRSPARLHRNCETRTGRACHGRPPLRGDPPASARRQAATHGARRAGCGRGARHPRRISRHEDRQRPRAHAADRRRRRRGLGPLARHAPRPAVAAAAGRGMRRTEGIAQHAFVKYRVVGREPGQSLRFRFRDMPGFDGEHAFQAAPGGPRRLGAAPHADRRREGTDIQLGWRSLHPAPALCVARGPARRRGRPPAAPRHGLLGAHLPPGSLAHRCRQVPYRQHLTRVNCSGRNSPLQTQPERLWEGRDGAPPTLFFGMTGSAFSLPASTCWRRERSRSRSSSGGQVRLRAAVAGDGRAGGGDARRAGQPEELPSRAHDRVGYRR